MSEPMSAEVLAMQAAERRRWLTVAESTTIRASWMSTRDAVDKLVDKLDENPEDEANAQMFVLISSLVISGHSQNAHESVKTLAALMEEAKRDEDERKGTATS